MKTKLSKKTKRIIAVYLAALLLLYIIVEVLPEVTDIFETTQTLEPGTLRIAYETTGYLIKDESVGIAPEIRRYTVSGSSGDCCQERISDSVCYA